jgi:hypothetical protein
MQPFDNQCIFVGIDLLKKLSEIDYQLDVDKP